MNKSARTAVVVSIILCGLFAAAWATKLMEVRPIDNEHLMVVWKDGFIDYRDDGTGSCAYRNSCSDATPRAHGSPLNTSSAASTGTYTLTSADDADYGSTGKRPTNVWRKAKVNGATYNGNDYFLDHTIFLKLPSTLKQDAAYTLHIEAGTNTDVTSKEFTFDIFNSVSEAIHVNIIGYHPYDTVMKSADLYMWLGDGGNRDYSSYEGNDVIIYNVATGARETVGTVKHWKDPGVNELGNREVIKTGVWNCDFSSFIKKGTYRLAVEGVGCSPDFEIREDIYFEPYKTSVRGYFYMRIGQDSVGFGAKDMPVPRRPLYIPGKDPADFKVYLTTVYPGHPDWNSLGSGDKWDVRDWSDYVKSGSPTNPNAWGGHSDALDWDRHMGHVSNIWDLLLPYVLSNGILDEDNLQIAESGNGDPDIIDEARYEVDFWLRLRDENGAYCCGLNNPSGSVMYQAGARPLMAWANAANAAMLADCYRIAGNNELKNLYRDSAIAAYTYAENRSDSELDDNLGIGDASIRGRDMKMMAAAYLYNTTGETKYEDVVNDLSVISGSSSSLPGNGGQIWGTAAYLMAEKAGRTVHYRDLWNDMKASVIYRAKQRNVNMIDQRPSRRATDERTSWWQSTQTMQLVCIAHAVATSQSDKDMLKRALILEADYGLGRNPLNSVQMTGLGSRHAEDIYTTGQNDGYPGVHPGHTPYMNASDWGSGWWQGMPSWMYSKGYPDWDRWPHAEALWPVRYNYANSEFTPRQTMRGKMALLGYLYSLAEHEELPVGPQNGDTPFDIAHSVPGKNTAPMHIVTCNLPARSGQPYLSVPEGITMVRLISPNGRTCAVRNVHGGKVELPPMGNGVFIVNMVKAGR
ncbi:MAG: glycosyl hydrolase family 5 [Chitinivibrionales bacterium]|nr:glycosyl hydrolase family 5 [Chitinivibrionales bacterium]